MAQAFLLSTIQIYHLSKLECLLSHKVIPGCLDSNGSITRHHCTAIRVKACDLYCLSHCLVLLCLTDYFGLLKDSCVLCLVLISFATECKD